MREVDVRLYVGNQDDYENIVKFQNNWSIVHACKEPYHRQALGYTGKGAPKNHPEYLFARRDNRLILNLVDVDDPNFVSEVIIEAALLFIGESLNASKAVLIHCNQGHSRSPSIAILYMAKLGRFKGLSFEEAELVFKETYPEYLPAKGIREFLKFHWLEYNKLSCIK